MTTKIDPTEEECWDEVLKGNITEDDFKDMIYEMSAHKINYYETPHNHKIEAWCYNNDDEPIHTYIVKNENGEYVWEQYYKGSGGKRIVRVKKHKNPRLIEKLYTADNITVPECLEWLDEQDKDVYEKHHNTIMIYCARYIGELRKIISGWNSERPKEYRIKGVHKMKKDELIKIAEMGKYVAS